MTIYQYTPYTYLIGWSKLDYWYYGAQYGSSANPSNLWKTYFTSSTIVRQMREYCGEPDILEIRHTFNNEISCREWEAKVLKRMNVVYDNKWLNISFAKGIAPIHTQYERTEEHRKLMSKATIGIKKSKEARENIKKARLQNNNIRDKMHYSYDPKIYSFRYQNIVENCTKLELKNKYPEMHLTIHRLNLLTSNKCNHHKKWIIR